MLVFYDTLWSQLFSFRELLHMAVCTPKRRSANQTWNLNLNKNRWVLYGFVTFLSKETPFSGSSRFRCWLLKFLQSFGRSQKSFGRAADGPVGVAIREPWGMSWKLRKGSFQTFNLKDNDTRWCWTEMNVVENYSSIIYRSNLMSSQLVILVHIYYSTVSKVKNQSWYPVISYSIFPWPLKLSCKQRPTTQFCSARKRLVILSMRHGVPFKSVCKETASTEIHAHLHVGHVFILSINIYRDLHIHTYVTYVNKFINRCRLFLRCPG